MGLLGGLDNGLGGIGGIFGKNCNVLFFILVFLLLFWNGFDNDRDIIES
jgi:hypothetical protein